MPTTRFRTRGGFQYRNAEGAETIWSSCSNSSWSSAGAQPAFSYGDRQEISDVVTPNFHERLERGEIFMNPVFRKTETRTWVDDSGAAGEKIGTPTVTCSGIPRFLGWRYTESGSWHKILIEALQGTAVANNMWVGDPNACPPFVHAVSDQDISDAVSEVSSRVLSSRGTTTVNQWETLYELKKSLGLLSQTLLSMARIGDSYVLRLRDGRGSRAAADLWAQARWAYRPLIASGNAAIDGIREVLEANRRETTRASVSLTASKPSSVLHNSWSTFSSEYGLVNNETVTVRAMQLDEETVARSTWEAVGFNTKGLLQLPWELVSKSFVLDWFLNVGDVLGAILPTPGFTPLGSCITVKREAVNTWTPLATTAKSGYMVTRPFGGSYTNERVQFQRHVGPLQAKLVIRSDFRFDDLYRCLDLLALARQRFRF